MILKDIIGIEYEWILVNNQNKHKLTDNGHDSWRWQVRCAI